MDRHELITVSNQRPPHLEQLQERKAVLSSRDGNEYPISLLDQIIVLHRLVDLLQQVES